jgi:murein L,D-transpeptidase YcbB/YkuD
VTTSRPTTRSSSGGGGGFVSRITSFFTGTPTITATAPATPQSLSAFIETLIQVGVIPAEKAVLARAIAAPTPVTTISSSSFKTNLQLHDSGPEVRTLQNFLIKKGFLAQDAVTGYYGPKTVKAVEKYQASVGMTVSGYFGPRTRATVKE